MQNHNITYVFTNGRKNRLHLSKKEYPKEFFYSYHFMNEKFNNIRVIEFEKNNTLSNKLLDKFSYILRYVTTVPFYLENITTYKNFKIFIKTDYLILTNQRVAFSAIPLLFIARRFKKINTSVFIMGFFIKQSNNFFRILFRKILTRLLYICFDNLIFLGKSEYEHVIKTKGVSNKFHFLPFPVDTGFWKISGDLKRNNILFIGNDGKRDYETVVSIANELKEYTFTLISSKINPEKISSENVKFLKGHWANSTLTDLDIRNIYEESSLSIIPLKNSLQPSGQSVALQSMSMGVPVLMTKTDGFWDYSVFQNNKNIYFIESNDIKLWCEKISLIMKNPDLSKKIANNAKSTIHEMYTINEFDKKLFKIIF